MVKKYSWVDQMWRTKDTASSDWEFLSWAYLKEEDCTDAVPFYQKWTQCIAVDPSQYVQPFKGSEQGHKMRVTGCKDTHQKEQVYLHLSALHRAHT